MPMFDFRTRLAIALLASAFLALTAGPARAVIMKLTPLAEVLETEDFIFVGTVDKLDPDKPSAVFKIDKKLKGEAPFDKMAVNMTGNAEAKKNNDTKMLFERLDPSRPVVFFVSKRGKKYNAMAFVEGTWFSLQGTQDDTDKLVRWAFQSGEPYLRRTFKGTSAELVKVLEDGLAKKAKPPAPDDKEKPGYGPPVEKKGKEPEVRSQESGVRSQESGIRSQESGVRNRRAGQALFGVIPSFVLVGPLAIVAALFPGLFARLAVGMKRWRAFLVIASLNSSLALIFYFLQTYDCLPAGMWFGAKAFTAYLMLITASGLVWAGYRYRRIAAEEPAVTAPPTRVEIYTLAGLTVFAAVSVFVSALFTSWGTNLEIPMREFTFIGIGLLAATLYAAYRSLTAGADVVGSGSPPERRLSFSGEMVGLGMLFLCGFAALLSGGASNGTVAAVTESGDADAIGPRLTGDVKVYDVKKSTQIISGITIHGDRLYFGTRFTRSTSEGNVVCMNRHTGEELWRFGDDEGMLPVFCRPRVVDGRVYCGEGMHEDSGCRMFCFSAIDGKPLWGQPIKTTSHTEGAPVVVGNKLIFPAGDNGAIAVEAATGAQLWQFPGGKDAGIHVDAPPAVSGNRVFIGSGLYSFVAVCLDADTGAEKWRTDLKLRSFGAPLVLGQNVFYGVGTGNIGADVHDYPEENGNREKEPAGAVVCLETDTGKEVWRYNLTRSVHTGLAGDAFSVYACSRDGTVYALDRKTGQLRWSTTIGKVITSGPAVATTGGVPVAVYAVSREGMAACLNPHTGKVVWQKPLPGFRWDGREENGVLSGPSVVTTATAAGSKRTIYIGAMTVDPDNDARKTGAVYRFDDELGE